MQNCQRDQEIIRVTEKSPFTLRQIASHYGLTPERIRQIVDGRKSSGKLRHRRRRISLSGDRISASLTKFRRDLYAEVASEAAHYYRVENDRHFPTNRSNWRDRRMTMIVNSKKCRIYGCVKPRRTSKTSSCLYYQFNCRSDDDTEFVIVVCGHKRKIFYIFPRVMLTFGRCYYIPVAGYHLRVDADLTKFKDGWHLLSNN